ncbi:MAG: hypothetical protein WDM76_13440 [Limisphaerales bacterium]
MLVLKGGRVLAAGGEKTAVLNSRNLSNAFGARMQLQQTEKRYALKITIEIKRDDVNAN